jgi:hypothetical protein
MAFSKLLNGDPQDFTPAQCGAQFAQEARRISDEQKIDLPAAWRAARLLHPDVHARLCQGALANATAAGITVEQQQEQQERKALVKDYAAAFKDALVECNNDPIRAHALVMKRKDQAKTIPNLKDKFKVKPVA